MSQTEESQKIIKRFFEVLQTLIKEKKLRGIKTFCDEVNIDRWNFYKLRKNPSSDIMQIAWLSYLVDKYEVSAEWLLTGKGKMFKK
jgi:hypothetical protein